jgi:hypothetical protein
MDLPQRSCGRHERPPDRRVASGRQTKPARTEPPEHQRVASRLRTPAPFNLAVGCTRGSASVAVLLRLGSLEQQRVCRLLCNRMVFDPAGHDEEIAYLEHDRLTTVQLNAKRPLPAQEQLVFVVVVPRKLAVETSGRTTASLTATRSWGLNGSSRLAAAADSEIGVMCAA